MGNEPEKIETRGLLLGAAGAFGAGLMGAIWHTKRKQAKEAAAEAKAAVAAATTNSNLNTTNTAATASLSTPASLPTSPKTTSIPEYTPPKMTPAEYAVAKQEARFFAFKALGYGTLLALSGAGVLAVGISYWLDVNNFKEFSDKLQVIVPRQTSKLRALLGGKEFVMKPEEQEEWDRAVENDE